LAASLPPEHKRRFVAHLQALRAGGALAWSFDNLPGAAFDIPPVTVWHFLDLLHCSVH